jgi:hypothetical protein
MSPKPFQKVGVTSDLFELSWFHYVPTRLDYSDLPTILGLCVIQSPQEYRKLTLYRPQPTGLA